MALTDTPQANRLHIAFYGRMNVGKSSLINLLTDQPTALVSNTAGTTTDPVIKSMEIFPLGPVALIDTAGFDDTGELGNLRVTKTKELLKKTDLAILVVSPENIDNLAIEKEWIKRFNTLKIPYLLVLNKCYHSTDSEDRAIEFLTRNLGNVVVKISALNKLNKIKLLQEIIKIAPQDFEASVLSSDLYSSGDYVVLVVPQDIQAPKGRLILPQVQVIRDILDNGATPLLTKPENLESLLSNLKTQPQLVITDSQMFDFCEKILPKNMPLTSFSVIFSRAKGDFETFIKGAKTIPNLKPSDKILIAEACTHAPLDEDIGRVKIPRMLKNKLGIIKFDIATGLTFPQNLNDYALIIHCGGCMFTRRQLMSRISEAKEASVSITNYGLAIAEILGILDRATKPFHINTLD
ncbi:MAG: [FeFe] hydrogenase H-cluster maturation GTPase HydF [Synergistaceae bacterium]|nr:[FeFe] hydrogenase H-cluster maturation GTPase HydF [Synergistaceae bacterium]